jgi:hypothetical protein
MVLYPAGLTCSVTQTTNPPGNGPQDFAVGGGQFFDQFRNCQESFAVSTHSPDAESLLGTPADGTVNLAIDSRSKCSATGNLDSKVDCLYVHGNTADMTAVITRVSGANFAGFGTAGSEVAYEFKELQPTLMDEYVGQPSTGPCKFTATALPGTFDVNRGKITVHDNE